MKFLIAIFLSFTTLLLAQEVHEGDYFITGGTVEITMVVKGDVFAVGSQIFVKGRVDGDVIAIGGTLQIDGEVVGNARLIGGQMVVNGKIGKNLTAFGGNLIVNPGALVRGNAHFTGGEVTLAGNVRGGVTLNSSSAEIKGEIGQRLKGSIGQLHIGPQSVIGGDVEYKSSNELKMDPGAEIDGEVIYQPSHLQEFWGEEWKQKVIIGSKLLGILMNLFFSFVLGALYIKFFPQGFHSALNVLKRRPWAAVGVGLLTLILIPIICLLLLVSILGFPIGLALIAFSLLTFYTAKVLPIIWITRGIFPKMGNYWALFIGLIFFFILLQIPYVGGLLSFSFILLGLGAAMMGSSTMHPGHDKAS
ncbi:MAG: polymer-forming cytoskeletal protein [Verrucomicrobia bacterium]|nr:polymer-forming cytoskeletal protein [Verrucomicrobiota bacterium]